MSVFRCVLTSNHFLLSPRLRLLKSEIACPKTVTSNFNSSSCNVELNKRRFTILASADASQVATTEEPKAETPAFDLKSAQAVDIRVGKVLKAWKHPEADSLYVEEVELGEESGPRTICSGLVKYVPLEELENRLVLVLANLKPRNMRGVKSNGMLLAASDAAHENVELLVVPEGSEPGERIWFGEETDGESQDAALTPNQLQKKKVWEGVQPRLKTDGDGVVNLEGLKMRVKSGVIRSKTLKLANIS